jgi:hypothetical protein
MPTGRRAERRRQPPADQPTSAPVADWMRSGSPAATAPGTRAQPPSKRFPTQQGRATATRPEPFGARQAWWRSLHLAGGGLHGGCGRHLGGCPYHPVIPNQASRSMPLGPPFCAEDTTEHNPRSLCTAVGMRVPLVPVAELANPVNRPGRRLALGCRSGPTAPRSRVGLRRSRRQPELGWRAGCTARLGTAAPAAHLARRSGPGLPREDGPRSRLPASAGRSSHSPPNPCGCRLDGGISGAWPRRQHATPAQGRGPRSTPASG